MNSGEVMEIALKAGENLLCSGAEIYRVEETIVRICKSYNINAECFVLPTGIFLSIEGGNSYIKRIKKRTVDFTKIELINSFSRNISANPVDYKNAIKDLAHIESRENFSFGKRLVIAGATSLVYSLLFKGSIYDSIGAFFIGMIIYFLKEKLTEAGVFHFFEYFMSSLSGGIGSIVLVKIFNHLDLYNILIASIIILLPGVAFTSALKDALHGDLVSSQFRMAEAVFIAVAVAAGVTISFTLGIRFR